VRSDVPWNDDLSGRARADVPREDVPVDDTVDDPSDDTSDDAVSGASAEDAHGFVARLTARGRAVVAWAERTLEQLRQRIAVVDLAMRVHARDKEAAGTLLGSALAVRLFLFYVPLVLTTVGVAGLLGRYGGVDSVSSTVGVSGSLAREMDAVFEQRSTAPWIAIVVGIYGIAWTGQSLARALVLSSALSWELGGRQKLRVRAVGIVVGLVVGMALTGAIVNRIRAAAGLAIASVSFAAVAAVYLVLWLVLFLGLPRRTTDPGAALPGAAIMATVMTVLQMILQLYLPNRIESASSLYGGLGVVVALLGWFFFIGRAVAFSFAVNAVLYEQVGSVSHFVFGLPGVRILPRRVPAVRRFFDLDDDPDGAQSTEG
jgi:uncharacterized BrkB/YihY/UPF0761 family membrane protein